MAGRFNRLLDSLSEFLAARRGLMPLFGILLVLINAFLRIFYPTGWLVETDILLHLGIVIAILGFMLAWAL